MMRALSLRLFRRFSREDGTASIEFVFVVPIVLMIFMASIEAGFYMTKHVMMERGLDIVMRDVRLGKIGIVNHTILRTRICEATPILANCNSILKVEMRPVSTTAFDMPSLPATCVDRGLTVQPETTFTPGGSNEIMIVRICAVQDPIFPSTGIGLEMRADAMGGYQMVTASVFVNEPR